MIRVVKRYRASVWEDVDCQMGRVVSKWLGQDRHRDRVWFDEDCQVERLSMVCQPRGGLGSACHWVRKRMVRFVIWLRTAGHGMSYWLGRGGWDCQSDWVEDETVRQTGGLGRNGHVNRRCSGSDWVVTGYASGAVRVVIGHRWVQSGLSSVEVGAGAARSVV